LDSNILNNEFEIILAAKDRIDQKFAGFNEGNLKGVVDSLKIAGKSLEGFIGFMISYREDI
jgi:hypothetical protein